MNKLLYLAILSGAATTAQAQTAIPAGTILLGGGIGYSHQTQKAEILIGNTPSTGQSVRSQFLLAPSVGYFIADNLAIGLDLGYTASKNKFTSAITGVTNSLDPNTTLRVGPYVQYYKMLSDQFGILGTLAAGYQHGVTNGYVTPSVTYQTKTNGYYAKLTPGLIFFPIPKLGISASIGSLAYDRTTEKPTTGAPVVSNFGASFGLDRLQFGGTYYFGR
jgi:hypothetical protein